MLCLVRRKHFETLRPICPVCRNASHAAGLAGFPLSIAMIARTESDHGGDHGGDHRSDHDDEHDEHIMEGVLHCTNPECKREYPIIDGVPLIIAALRDYLSENLLHVYARTDLSPAIESILGDCNGSGSSFDRTRQYLSSYVWDHYGDLDPEEREPAAGIDAAPRPGAALRMLQQGMALADPLPDGPILDIGCSVGRTALALAEAHDRMVLGVDLYYPALRLAGQVLRQGRVEYPRRRVGLVYDRRAFPVALPGRERVDVWACDATALPFAPNSFAAAIALNVIDSVQAPLGLLNAMARVLAPGGAAVLSCPYDWAAGATPVASWIGGHSQRADDRGASETVLRRLLTPGALPWSVDRLSIVAERHAVPWQVRLHERSTMLYQSHLVVARASDAAPAA